MFAIVGLGNPGRQYAATRHNVGARVILQLLAQLFPEKTPIPWKEKFGVQFVRTELEGVACLCILPQSYMNESGSAVARVLHFFQVEPAQLILIHDDLDLNPGIIRLRRGGSAAGHRGVLDVIEKISSEDFYHIRVGVGHPRNQGEAVLSEEEVRNWVLSRPSAAQQKEIEKGIEDATQALRLLLSKGLEEAQRSYNRKNKTLEELR